VSGGLFVFIGYFDAWLELEFQSIFEAGAIKKQRN